MKNSIKVLMFAMTLILCCMPYNYALGYNKTITDIIIESTDRLMDNNQTTQFTTTDGLNINFVDSDFFKTIDINDTPYGLYNSQGDGTIYINIEDIYYDLVNYTYSYNDTILMTTNSFMHELGHYIDTKGYIPGFRAAYNIETTEESILINSLYFESLHTTYILNNASCNIPDLLKNSVQFSIVYDSYDLEKRDEETAARLFALCWQEKKVYSNYWDMFELSNYSLCSEFTEYDDYFDNRLNSLGEDIVEAYINKYDTDYIYEKDFTNIVLTTDDGFNLVNYMVAKSADLVILLLPFSIIIVFLTFLISVIIGFKEDILKFIEKIVK